MSNTISTKAGIIGIDHVRMTVPDVQLAVNFFNDVLGFTQVFAAGAVSTDVAGKEGDQMQRKETASAFQVVNAGRPASIEVFSYGGQEGPHQHSGGDDMGDSHITFYTTDIESAIAQLRSKNIQLLGGPALVPSGDTAGNIWVDFLTPWGTKMKLISRFDEKDSQSGLSENVLGTPQQFSGEGLESLVEQHLFLWNETDPGKRQKIMTAIYAENIVMVDRHFIATGHKQIDGFITDLQQKGSGFSFSHVKPVEVHHNIARLFWQVGSKEKPAVKTGMDLFVMENGRIAKLYVFVDAAE